MPFLATKIQPNGAKSSAHQVVRLEVVEGHATAVVNSYAMPEALHAGMLNWQDSFAIPAKAVADAQAWLVSSEGPFAGGTIIDDATPLARARTVRWAQIKAERDTRETAGFSYMGRMVDSDARSLARISIAVCAAQAALVAGSPFEIDWTCADDTTLTLNALQMQSMPIALAKKSNQLHQTARALRERIAAALTLEDVIAVVWPSDPTSTERN